MTSKIIPAKMGTTRFNVVVKWDAPAGIYG
jgi:hypothetical protein